jgi:hypothetical protein
VFLIKFGTILFISVKVMKNRKKFAQSRYILPDNRKKIQERDERNAKGEIMAKPLTEESHMCLESRRKGNHGRKDITEEIFRCPVAK